MLIGYDKYAKFVDKQGKLKPSNKQASQLSFDNKAQAIGKAYIIVGTYSEAAKFDYSCIYICGVLYTVRNVSLLNVIYLLL